MTARSKEKISQEFYVCMYNNYVKQGQLFLKIIIKENQEERVGIKNIFEEMKTATELKSK